MEQPNFQPSQPASPNQPPPPFSCTYSPNLPELLQQMGVTMAISTYQAGKVVLISAKDENSLVQLPRTFNKAMGIAVGNGGNKLGIATKNEALVLVNSPELATYYPKQPQTYDALFVPRATYYTGQVDIHDLDFGKDGLWGVNTSFSCLCTVSEDYNFEPKWKPHFISKLVSEDRCHLNGMAMSDGEPLYVSSLGSGDSFQSWRENITGGGLIMHVPSNEIVMKDVPMPHSPRLYDGKLYVLLSATGEVATVNVENGTYDVITQLDGFVRGMDRYGDYLFVGLSKLRKNSSTFRDLPIAEKAKTAGVEIIHIPTGVVVAKLQYQASVDEIYDVQVLPNMRRPGILNTYTDTHRLALAIPDSTFWARENQEQQQQNVQTNQGV